MNMKFQSNSRWLVALFLLLLQGSFGQESDDSDDECRQIVDCRSSSLNPVCGSNGIIYASDCYRKHAACVNKTEISRVDWESCSFKECPRKCGEDYLPVCGKNGVLYNNLCEYLNACCGKTAPIKADELNACIQKKCDNTCSDSDDACEEKLFQCWRVNSVARVQQ